MADLTRHEPRWRTEGVTVDDVLSWEPCYSRSRVEDLFAGRPRLTAREIAALEIEASDRIWALLWLLPERERRLWACEVARSCLEAERGRGREPDPRSWAAVEVAERYARGEAAEEERSAAWSAARSAAWSAAWSAARSAAWSAARSAQVASLAEWIERKEG